MLVKHKMFIRSCSSGASSGSNRTRSRNAVLSAEGAKVAQQAVAATAEASPFVYISEAHRTYRDPGALSGLFFLWNTVQSLQRKSLPSPFHPPPPNRSHSAMTSLCTTVTSVPILRRRGRPRWSSTRPIGRIWPLPTFFCSSGSWERAGSSHTDPGHLLEGAGGSCANRHGGGLSRGNPAAMKS